MVLSFLHLSLSLKTKLLLHIVSDTSLFPSLQLKQYSSFSNVQFLLNSRFLWILAFFFSKKNDCLRFPLAASSSSGMEKSKLISIFVKPGPLIQIHFLIDQKNCVVAAACGLFYYVPETKEKNFRLALSLSLCCKLQSCYYFSFFWFCVTFGVVECYHLVCDQPQLWISGYVMA